MNGSYFQNPTFPTVTNEDIKEYPRTNNYYNVTPNEQISFENILKINRGKKIKLYLSFSNDSEWKNKTFEGILENSYKDFLIISDPNNGSWYILKPENINYIEFLEKIN